MWSWLIGPSPGQHPVDQRQVALDQPLDRRADPVLGEAAHLEQPRLELFQLLLKMRYQTFGHEYAISRLTAGG